MPAAENIHCFNESEAHVERMEDENLFEERLEAESSSNEETLEQSVERSEEEALSIISEEFTETDSDATTSLEEYVQEETESECSDSGVDDETFVVYHDEDNLNDFEGNGSNVSEVRTVYFEYS